MTRMTKLILTPEFDAWLKGYRVYFTQRGDVLVIVLCGGDKSTQCADIKWAKAIAKELED